ncbi:MAG: aminotransferase class V-fold PLP-dependent enzyme [Clostridia bacterium]|nr:aminotransferase class V-fold PLP-dependent enzyme [Clostridia bacterium]
MIYFDNAATTFPKPRAVGQEIWNCVTRYGGNPGRGAHTLSLAAAEKIFSCRCLAAELLGVEEPERVFFTLNTTYALNTVLKGLLRPGDHVILSDLEHNAVYRPLYKMEQEGRITTSVFRSMVGDPARTPTRICAGIARLIRPETRMVVCVHSSNLCSAVMPIREIGAFCHRHGLLFVVDAAQSAGHEPISVDGMNIDALCVPGHKGLYGPQGCGLVALGKEVLPDSLVEGGNGFHSLEGSMPDFPPERFEAGTLPTPAIAGLCEGIRSVNQLGIEEISAYEKKLYRAMRERLRSIPEVTLYASEYEGAVLLFSVTGISPERVGQRLNDLGICVRSGYHCSALGHKTLGTPEGGGIRVSFGIYNQLFEVDQMEQALRRIIREG